MKKRGFWKASRAVRRGKDEAQERSVICALIVIDRHPKKI